ncbi:hypothetical protein J0B03_04065 [Alkalibacter rhizosphaerae]|uniref:Uncharacterized protein n=1 Tax=Alkalibacter rhizosphaerae TaxID=2815577 RepID=A0A974XGG9_9FIRM|nr:hypothetical protein [Alkalibacter rhizosphaerae]QSX09246.1 hypothetical protein J0B03_04065 [Alkalibacter rhizosphaerae]
MQRVYEFDPKRYQFKVVYTGYFLILIAVVLTGLFIMNTSQLLYLFGAVVAVYGIINTFFLKSNPGTIRIDDNMIRFISFGEVVYELEDLTRFQIKEFANAQFYIRVEDNSGQKGRYWVSYYYFSDQKELIDELYLIEKKIHPISLKFRGRENMFNVRPCYQVVSDENEIDPFFKDVDCKSDAKLV